MNLTFKQFLVEASEYKMETLKKNKTPLTDEERDQAIAAKAVWHPGNRDKPISAIWKSIINGKTVYVTNTHRQYATAPTLKDAIHKYHTVIKQTA